MINKELRESSVSTFDIFQKSIVDYSVDNKVKMGLDPTELTRLQALQQEWDFHHQKCKNANSVSRFEKKLRGQVRDKYVDALIPFIKHSIYGNSKVKEPDLVAMILPVPKRRMPYSIRMAVDAHPDLSIETVKGSSLLFRCTDQRGRGQKPPGVKVVQIRYALGDDIPVRPEDYPFNIVSTSCKGVIRVSSIHAGKWIHVIACWIGSRQEESIYSHPESTLVLP